MSAHGPAARQGFTEDAPTYVPTLAEINAFYATRGECPNLCGPIPHGLHECGRCAERRAGR